VSIGHNSRLGTAADDQRPLGQTQSRLDACDKNKLMVDKLRDYCRAVKPPNGETLEAGFGLSSFSSMHATRFGGFVRETERVTAISVSCDFPPGIGASACDLSLGGASDF